MKLINPHGMILLEILMSVAILSGGLVLVYYPLLTSFHALDYAEHRMEANRLLASKIMELNGEAIKQGALSAGLLEGTVLGERQVYSYSVDTKKLVQDGKLLEMNWQFSWKSSGLKKAILRSTYLLLPYEATA